MKVKNNISASFSGSCFFLLLLLFVLIPPRSFASPDAYEPDNTIENATPILLHDTEFSDSGDDVFQSHNFYHTGDEDWVRFHALRGQFYTVKVKEPSSGCNAIIGIYDKFGDLQIPEEVNDEPVGTEEYAPICSSMAN